MIVRSVRLTLITKVFDDARSRIDAIVRQSQGYVEQLTIKGGSGSARTLSATLRLPADRVEAGLTELRRLGQAKEESQNSLDVTSQYVDLAARLTNARNTEQRLLKLLSERTGNLRDVVEAEREVARVREEIERMEAQRKNLSARVQFATVQLELSEEYQAQLEPSLPSGGTRLRNAAIEGYRHAVETALETVLVTLRYGPTVLLLLGLLCPVAFVLWRRRAKFI
jgi:hypothetical protein